MFRGLFGWLIFAVLLIGFVTNPEAAAGLVNTVIGWVTMTASALGTFVNAVA